MKKLIALLMVVVLCISLCACGGGNDTTETTQIHTEVNQEPSYPKLQIGETVSTDIIDFTISDVSFAIFAENTLDDLYLTPTDDSTSMYGAPIGYTLVIPTFEITNKDRAGSLDVGGPFSDWEFSWEIKYNGETYPVLGWDLNRKEGSDLDLAPCACLNPTTGEYIESSSSSNALIDAGTTEAFRILGMVNMEPSNLNDSFELTVNISNSKGEYEYFTYVIPAK